jgi:competence protein ComEA
MVRQLCSLVALTCLLAAPAHAAAQSSARPAAKPAASAGGAININTASAAEFESLPGIGAKTAARIIEYRQKNGPFKKIEELMNVQGVGEKSFLKLKPQLTITSVKGDHADGR